MEKFLQSLAKLLPTGFAWPRAPGATLMRVIRGIASSFNELHEFIGETVLQWQPHHAVTRLAEWEEATGLPDPCFALPQRLLTPGTYAYTPGELASFARPSPGMSMGPDGLFVMAAIDQPRVSFDPITRGRIGLLIEVAATNYQTQSDNYTTWTFSALTPVPNAAADRYGGNGAVRIVPTAVNTQHFMSWVAAGLTAGAVVSRSILIKPDGYYAFALRVGQGGTYFQATVDLNAGTIVPSGTVLPMDCTITSYGNGEYLVTITGAVPGLTTYITYLYVQSTPGVSSFLGDGVKGLLLGPSQFELGTPTSLIQTGAAAVSRAADVAYVFPPKAEEEALRRKLLLLRLRPQQLFYENSSPASPAAIEAICKEFGYDATVRYNLPFRVGRNRVGDRLGALDGRLYVFVTLTSQPFRVGKNRVGTRLRLGSLNGGELACYLPRVVPARFEINIIFV